MAHRALLVGILGGLVVVGTAATSCDVSTGTAPCDSVYEGLCGAPCVFDADCPAGLYCGSTGCTADCSPDGGECSSGTCDGRGRCSDGTGGTVLIGGGAPGGSGQGGGCPSVSVTFEPVTPSVVLLIDQSGSMTTDFNGQPRWDAVYHALMDPTGVVPALESSVRFGLALYTYDTGPTCPQLVEVMPPALDAAAAIDAAYAPAVPINNTPTGESVAAIAPVLAAFGEPGPKVIVLATDGDPDSCADPNSNGTQPPKDLAVAAVQAAFQEGIETYVIAVGDQVSAQHQQDMANAGRGMPVPATYPCDPATDPATCAQTFQPATQADLVSAFESIVFGQRSCVLAISGGTVTPGGECAGTVLVNGNPVPCNDPNGWQLASPTSIEFLGTTCDIILNDPSVTVTATFPCDVITPR